MEMVKQSAQSGGCCGGRGEVDVSDVTDKTLKELCDCLRSSKELEMNQQIRIADALEAIRDLIADCVCKKPKDDGKALDVSWISQLGAGGSFAPGDCGPACAAMWLNFYGKTLSVDDVSKQTGLDQGFKFTTPAHIMRAMRYWGYETYWRRDLDISALYAEIDAGHPTIVLVEYDYLDNRYDPRYDKGHWLLVVGYGEIDGKPVVLYHDPYWPDRRGEFVEMDADRFLAPWGMTPESGNSIYQAIRIRRSS